MWIAGVGVKPSPNMINLGLQTLIITLLIMA
jgi:hypothetical protein